MKISHQPDCRHRCIFTGDQERADEEADSKGRLPVRNGEANITQLLFQVTCACVFILVDVGVDNEDF